MALVASVLPLVALFQVFDGLAGTTGGVLRARGRQVSRSRTYRRTSLNRHFFLDHRCIVEYQVRVTI